MASGRSLVVYAAIAANGLIAIVKFIAAYASGSSAMASEGIHSVVDTANEGLLLLGIWQAKKRPDANHPYGYGKEIYFWSLIVAIVIFGLGGGMSVYQGIVHIVEPVEIEDVGWAYGVLACAFVFEGISFTLAAREFSRTMGRASLWRELKAHKDPSIYSILVEDAAALVGVVLAFLGIFLSRLLSIKVLDGIASIAIGLLLAAVAIFLARESKGLIVGEAADPEIVRSIRAIAESDPAVERIDDPLTMHLGPDQILLNLSIEFRSEVSGSELTAAIDRIERCIRERHPQVIRMFVESESLKERPERGP